METRLKDVPALKITGSAIDARHYNRVRLALLRLGRPLRFESPHLRGMDVTLSDEAWICLDRTLNDLPVLAWTDFEGRQRDSLHRPVLCRLRFYHAQAGLVVKTVLNDIDAVLAKRLGPRTHITPARIRYFPRQRGGSGASRV